jgi:hypothetical protein
MLSIVTELKERGSIAPLITLLSQTMGKCVDGTKPILPAFPSNYFAYSFFVFPFYVLSLSLSFSEEKKLLFFSLSDIIEIRLIKEIVLFLRYYENVLLNYY